LTQSLQRNCSANRAAAAVVVVAVVAVVVAAEKPLGSSKVKLVQLPFPCLPWHSPAPELSRSQVREGAKDLQITLLLPKVRVVGQAQPTGVRLNMSLTKQPSVSTKHHQPAPKGKGKRSYHKAVGKALQDGSVQNKGRQMTLQELGGIPAPPKTQAHSSRAQHSAFLEQQQVAYLSWNAGSLTTAAWEELLSMLKTPTYSSVRSGNSGDTLAR